MKQFSKFFLFVLLSVAALSFTSCSKDDGPDQAALDQQTQIQQQIIFNKSMKESYWFGYDYSGSVAMFFDEDDNDVTLQVYLTENGTYLYANYKYSCNVTVTNGMVMSKSITFTRKNSGYDYTSLPKKLTAKVSNGTMVLKNGDTGKKIAELEEVN